MDSMDFKTGRQYSGTFSKIYDCLGRELEMELYQIWTTYNKEWSKRETILFGAIFVLNIVIIPYDSYHESQITIPTIRGNRTSNTLFSSTCKVADAQ